MGILKLVYFEGCPNVDKARKLLQQTGTQFEEVQQNTLPKNHPDKGYASPTVLDDKKIIFGAKTGRGGCSLDIPNVAELQRRLSDFGTETKGHKSKSGLLSTIGSIGSAMTVGLCPICIPAIGAFLSAVGLGFLVQESVLRSFLFVFIGVTLFGLFWSYHKEHRKIAPFLLGVVMSVGLYVGRYEYIGALVNSFIIWGSIIGIVAVSVWNIRLKKQASCPACVK